MCACASDNLSAPFLNELICRKCLIAFQEQALQCGHSLCSTCAGNTGIAMCICPECGKNTQVGPVVTSLQRIVESLKIAGVIVSQPPRANDNMLCHGCESSYATLWCVSCGALCALCSDQVHSVLKNHKTMALTDIVAFSPPIAVAVTEDKTGTHANDQPQSCQHNKDNSCQDYNMEATIFVSNLPFIVNDCGMGEIFEGCNIYRAHVCTHKGKSKGFAYVEFKTKEDMEKAFAVVEGTIVEGREIRLQKMSK